MGGSRDTCLAMRSSCQTRALILNASGQGTRPMRHPCRSGRRETSCFPPCLRKGLKPSLATTHAKASRRVIATLWSGDGRRGTVFVSCSLERGDVLFSALRKKRRCNMLVYERGFGSEGGSKRTVRWKVLTVDRSPKVLYNVYSILYAVIGGQEYAARKGFNWSS